MSDPAPPEAPLREAAQDGIDRMLPIRIVSRVVRGFGRGSKDLGIPTANLACGSSDACRIVTAASSTNSSSSGSSSPPSSSSTLDELPTGIYWGFCRIGNSTAADDPATPGQDSDESLSAQPTTEQSVLGVALPCAVSIGYNPTYGNDFKTIEPHLIAPKHDPRRHASSCRETLFSDFYGQPCRLSVVGYLRPELPFEGLDKLTEAIKSDIAAAEHLSQQADPRCLAEREWVEGSAEL
jgi:riboflavin kinase